MEVDSENLKIYEQHLNELEEALQNPECPNRNELLQLASDLTEFIGLISSNKNEVLSDVVKDEHSNDATCSNAESKPTVDSLIGLPCFAPYNGAAIRLPIRYHRAVIMEADYTTGESLEDLWVKVLYSYPFCKSMQPCKFFLDGSCNFEQKCRFSHGELLKFSDLLAYEKPDFENVSPGTRCLVKEDDELWKLGTVTCLYLDEAKVIVKIFDTGFQYTKSFNDIIPLKEGNMECISVDDESGTDEEYPGSSVSSVAPAPSPVGLVVGDWEKHTRGIGSKLMARMGYIAGKGLGKESKGRTEPVKVEIFPAGKSLDVCLETKLKRENKHSLLRLKVQKRKEKLKEQKASRGYFKPANNNMFDFINDVVNQVAKEEGSLKTVASQPSSAKTLNVQLLNTEESIKEASKRVESLRQSLRRSEDRHDRAVTSRITAKLQETMKQLTELKRLASRLRAEQQNRREQHKLKSF